MESHKMSPSDDDPQDMPNLLNLAAFAEQQQKLPEKNLYDLLSECELSKSTAEFSALTTLCNELQKDELKRQAYSVLDKLTQQDSFTLVQFGEKLLRQQISSSAIEEKQKLIKLVGWINENGFRSTVIDEKFRTAFRNLTSRLKTLSQEGFIITTGKKGSYNQVIYTRATILPSINPQPKSEGNTHKRKLEENLPAPKKQAAEVSLTVNGEPLTAKKASQKEVKKALRADQLAAKRAAQLAAQEAAAKRAAQEIAARKDKDAQNVFTSTLFRSIQRNADTDPHCHPLNSPFLAQGGPSNSNNQRK